MIYNKKVEAPFVPTYNSPSDTSNFEQFSDEDAVNSCNDVDQSHFINF